MFFFALMLPLALGATTSRPSICAPDCEHVITNTTNLSLFRHVSELDNSSVAPWTLNVTTDNQRFPASIRSAVCRNCLLDGMVSKPIMLEIYIYKMVDQRLNSWCQCPLQIAVGCTCVQASLRG
ncbi:interleukin-17F-like [Echeneis naucrates]|uniref:interleukin-17F-like n=1 Tax=Echeneis naucrates TaxID=173247 RepID=UPI001113EA9B|nr:interleukin-17F-like [Echeneis naucrates]